MSGIFGTRDVPPRTTLRSKSSPDGDFPRSPLINGVAESSGEKAKIKIDPSITETPKIPYKMSGVVIERTRTRSGNSEEHSCNGENEGHASEKLWKKKTARGSEQNQHSPCNSAKSAPEELLVEKEVMERNYASLMQQLATALVEKETLAYQVQLLGQAYGELKTQLTSLAEREDSHPSRLECLRDERHRLADYIIALTAADSNKKPTEGQRLSTTSLRTQRDLWRNKFLASSLIVDELSNQRLFLLHQFEDAQQVVIGLIEEKEMVRKGLFDAFLYLQETKETLDPLDHGKYRHLTISHSVENLVAADQELSRALHRRLLNTIRVPSARGFFADDAAGGSELTVIPSEMEKQAKKVIEVDVKAFAASNPCEDFQRLINERAQAAGLPPPNMHNIVVNCCKRCEGQIKVV